ncbi:MAG: Clp protease ClpP [Cellvibrionaceae bacterium]|nr:Clp protease ClpP [Cellvibrionaceae bacterium]
MPKSWFSVKNLSSDSVDIDIHEEIGLWGVSAKNFIDQIKNKNIKTINLSINSPGGNFFDGLAMYHALKNHSATVNITVLALAGSAASIVLMAGDKVSMPEDTYIFIHDPSSCVCGNAEDFREAADLLDRFRDNIVNIYVKRTGLAKNKLETMMANEEFISAEDAVNIGFADELIDTLPVAANAASFSRYFKNMPQSLLGRQDVKNNHPENLQSIQDLEGFLRDAGNFSRSLAVATVSKARDLLQSESVRDQQVIEEAVSQLAKFQLSIN